MLQLFHNQVAPSEPAKITKPAPIPALAESKPLAATAPPPPPSMKLATPKASAKEATLPPSAST